LEDLRGRLAAGPRRIAALTAAVQEAESRRDAAKDAVMQTRLAADRKQLQLKTAEAKLADLEAKLNACKSNKEYQLFRDQIAADRMAGKVLEDEILESLERIDGLKPAVPAAEEAIAAARRKLADEEARVAAEVTQLEAEVARISGDVQATEQDLAEDLREKYQRAVRHKGADGMAAADGRDCGGCHQQITSNQLSELLGGRIVTCRSCGRLLYTPESATPA
jgi:predicted  nucleic acid-binding Zn-ribbon protein